MKLHPEKKPFDILPGIGLAAAIAGVSQFISRFHPAIDALLLALLLSIIVANLAGVGRTVLPGVDFTREHLIPLGIILYGTQLDFLPVRQHGHGHIIHIILMVAFGVLAISFFSKAIGIRKKTALLLAAGASICGASAIVVLSPVIRADKEDTSVSLLAVTVVGLMGVILYPLIQEALQIPEEQYGILCGSTLFQVGQVRATASLLGATALSLAVPMKLIRVGMLLPVAVVYSLISGRERNTWVPLPWFLVGFFITVAAVNIWPVLALNRAVIAPAATFLFSTALAGIGLSVDLESIINAGPRPFIAAFMGLLILIALFAAGWAVIT